MTLAEYKEMYAHEWTRREQLQNAANTPISVVTLAGGGLLLMAKWFASQEPFLSWPFWLAAAVAGACLATAVFFVIRSLHGYEYERIPYASELAKYYEDVKLHYKNLRLPGLASDAFEEFLVKRYIEATDANARNNLRRGEYLHRANNFLVYGICAVAVAAVPAGIVSKSNPEPAEKVEITNLRSEGNALIQEWRGSRDQSGPAGTAVKR